MEKKDAFDDVKGKPSKLIDLIVPPSLQHKKGERQKRNQTSLKPFMDSSFPCVHTNSVAKDMQLLPQKKFVVTRAYRLEQFLWHEFYNEYLLATDRLNKLPPTEYYTEYSHEFGKTLLPKNEEKHRELEQKYPLYGSDAISLWNKNGDRTCSFKRAFTVTRPFHERSGQFG